MPRTLVLSDSIADSADVWPPAFVRSWTKSDRDAAWVHVAGDLNRATVPPFLRTLQELQFQARLVVLDLRDLVQVDSSGVHAIVDASVRARRAGRRLVLLRGSPNVDRAFTLTGSSDDVEIGDFDPVESPVEVIVSLAERGRG